ncbi:MAG: hypothetical protein LC624_12705 [Halobacteriales archaeon]|nr:hypothetical protein [Halobacteriales archaeon]
MLPIVGPAWPEQRHELLAMAEVVAVGNRIGALRANAFIPSQPSSGLARSRRAADGGPAMRGS